MGRTLRTLTVAVLVGLIGAACGGDTGPQAVRGRLGGTPPPQLDAATTGDASPGGTAGDAGASRPESAAVVPAGGTAGAAGPSARPAPVERAGATAGSQAQADTPRPERPAGPATTGGDAASHPPAATGDAGAAPSADLPGPAAGSRTGVTDQEVTFGMHLPQSGPVGFLVGDAWHGAEAYFRSVNDAGGVHGRKIRFVISDDGYSAQKAAGAIRDLVDTKKVFGASCLAGADQCVVGLEYANAKGVPYVHAGMRESVVEQAPWAFPVTASYAHAAERLADYLFTKRGYTKERKIGALHVNSINFDEMMGRFERRLASYGSKLTVKYPAEKDQSDFSAAITKMQNAGVDTVWYAVDPTLIAKFASQAKLLRFEPQYVFAPLGGDLYAEVTGGNLDGAFGLSMLADPHWNGAGVREFRKTFSRYYPDEEPDEITLLAYAEAQAFVEGLRRAGPDLGRDAFARGMATIDHFDTGLSSPISYTRRARSAAANSGLAVCEIHGTRSDQITGFDF